MLIVLLNQSYEIKTVLSSTARPMTPNGPAVEGVNVGGAAGRSQVLIL